MNPKQTLPVSIGSSKIYHIRVTALDLQFLAYHAGSQVIILSSELVVVQVLDTDSCVSCLSWDCSTGKLAVSTGHSVLIYILRYPPKPIWELESRLGSKFPPKSISWSTDGQYILVAGSFLELWDLCDEPSPPSLPNDRQPQTKAEGGIPVTKAKSIFCQSQEPNPDCDLVSISPDSRLFFTLVPGDCFVKVWYKRKKVDSRGFSFIYLSHPNSVVSCSWRTHPVSRTVSRNVLLTLCLDGELRVWVESDFDQKLQFTVCECHVVFVLLLSRLYHCMCVVD
eukprot:TRINITY_DN5539_c0_g1_i12.p1 TRINITY_DN5539_c0_g1~~TRINITY_DN5539_c0_g1_i12.p1  ORF type:complete len:281 (+),score=29.69 TRINITY_DN5539_c0_g1_i12:153-995(+)